MNIVEVKNNLVKLSYENDLKLSELIIINDSAKSYIAQIIHLESVRAGKFAIAKIVFNYDGQIRAYDKSIPSLRSGINVLEPSFILDKLHSENPLLLGRLSGSDSNIVVDFDIFNDIPIVLSEKFYITKYLLNNLALQVQARDKKFIVFDTAGLFKTNRLTLSKDFKLPLDNCGLDYIYEGEFVDATTESKAFIQPIFEELGEYAKTVDFIPFDTFKSVIDNEFERTKLIQLVVMKNKLKQIRDLGIFAQTCDDFGDLQKKILDNKITVIDLSKVNKLLQAECIAYIYSILSDLDDEFYCVTPLFGSKTSVLDKIYASENIHTMAICDYGYEHLDRLKQLSKNMIMFSPLKQQKDFGGYNIFLQKLAEDEFIAYGKMTKFIPLIGKLYQMSASEVRIPVQSKTEESASPVEVPKVDEEAVQADEDIVTEAVEAEDNKVGEVIAESDTKIEEVSSKDVDENLENAEQTEQGQIEEFGAQEINEAIPSEIEDIGKEPIDEIVQPEIEEVQEVVEDNDIVKNQEQNDITNVQISEMAGATAEAIVEAQNITEEKLAVDSVNENIGQDEVAEALAQVPDIEDEEELSDDDLDMIEKLSKSDDEIEVINEQQPDIETNVEVEESSQENEENSQAETIVIQEESSEEIVETEENVPSEGAAEDITEGMVSDESSMNEDMDNETASVQMPSNPEPLQTRTSASPSVPEYSADIPAEDKVNSDVIQQGDKVYHEEFGEGVVEKMINYGDKVLCSVNFASVGRRLLNPEISEMKKI